MIWKCFLPFGRFPFYFVVDGFVCYVEHFNWLCSHVFFFFLFLTLLLVSDPKVITKTDVKELTDYIFFQEFYDFVSHIQVFNSFLADFCVWYKIGVLFHSVACGYSVFPALFIEENLHSPLFVLSSFVKNNWWYMYRFISCLYVLFHWLLKFKCNWFAALYFR